MALGLTLTNLMTLYEAQHIGHSGLELFDYDYDERIDQDVLMNEIIKKCGMLQPIDDSIQGFRWLHVLWWRKNGSTVSKMLDTVEFEYNPIENYNMEETFARAETDNDRNTGTVRDDRSIDVDETTHEGHGGTDTDTETLGIGNTTENFVSAFNESLYQPREKTTTTPTSGSNTNQTSYGKKIDGTRKEGTSDSNTETRNLNNDRTENEAHILHRHGNIGVTTTQQMIEQERKILEFNIYDWIVKKYRKDNFYLVY